MHGQQEQCMVTPCVPPHVTQGHPRWRCPLPQPPGPLAGTSSSRLPIFTLSQTSLSPLREGDSPDNPASRHRGCVCGRHSAWAGRGARNEKRESAT